MNLNLHKVAKVIISENSKLSERSQSRDLIFLDHDGNILLDMDLFSSDKDKGIEIQLIDNESYTNWKMKQIEEKYNLD